MRLHRVLGGLALTLSAACSGGSSPAKPAETPQVAKPPAPPPPADEHAPKVLGEIDGITVASYAAVGLDALTPSQRALAYHLTQAALQGDVIYTMQRSHFGLAALKTVRTLLASGDKLNVTIRLDDGRLLEERQDRPRGGPDLPMTWEEIEAKFRGNATLAISEERASRIVEAVARLDRLERLAPLMESLTA